MGFFDHKIDISDVPDNAGSAPLPEGEYLMKAVAFKDDEISSKGNDMMTSLISLLLIVNTKAEGPYEISSLLVTRFIYPR